MSTCPEKDLHSIYLDGELPENFLKEYESHVASCEKCRAELEKLRKVSAPFRQEALSIKLDQNYLDMSFERLQTKMRFAQNTAFHEEKHNFKNYTKWISGFAAAAAVFAVIITPVQLNSARGKTSENLTAIARPQIKPIHENKVVVDGNLDQFKFSAALGSAKENEVQSAESQDKTTGANINKNQKVVSATSLASNYGDNFSDIDVFRPDFNNSSASVRIPLPGMNAVPMTQAGNFEAQ